MLGNWNMRAFDRKFNHLPELAERIIKMVRYDERCIEHDTKMAIY